jgi:hypothetical protein
VQGRKLAPSLAATLITVASTEGIFGMWLAIDLPKGFLGF